MTPLPPLKRSRVPLNITVPAEMRHAMRGRPDLNFSRICEAAIAAALAVPARDVIHVSSWRHPITPEPNP